MKIISNNNGEPKNTTSVEVIDLESEPQDVGKRLMFVDVFLLIVGHSLIAVIMLFFCGWFMGVQIFNNADSQQLTGLADGARVTAPEHPLIQLLSRDNGFLTLFVTFICAVILAPLTEEFLYRGILTGWVAGASNVYFVNKGMSLAMAKFLSTAIAVIVPAFYFAMLHFGNQSGQSVEVLFVVIISVIFSNMITIVVGLFYLVLIRDFTFERLGFWTDNFLYDIFLSFLISVFVIPPILLLTGILRNFFPEVVIDPFPLFLFAIVLGVVFLKTRRLFPCILIHVALNGVSFASLVLR
ncbi:MAG: CPBP family intramembrane metalloprotease [Planctomycetaceae bacterium]|jgi:membrane protease YdiL (CAAX protease family)|nr:CPBP family intramembrane metalloprotease [Planctomycetaceae bacterium]